MSGTIDAVTTPTTNSTSGRKPRLASGGWRSFLDALSGGVLASGPIRRGQARRAEGRRMAGEELELRLLLSASIPANDERWTFIGPTSIDNANPVQTGTNLPANANQISGTVTSIAVDPNNPNRFFIGSDGGGVWRTTDGGAGWVNQTDFNPPRVTLTRNNPVTGQPETLTDALTDINGNTLGPEYRTQVIGAISVSKSNPNIIYAGTGGDAYGRDSYHGRGILKSVDGGATWTLIRGSDVTPNVPADPLTGFTGYTNTGEYVFDKRGISRVVIDPLDPNIVYVSVMQSVSDPQDAIRGDGRRNTGEQNTGRNSGLGGIWKSRDGGVTWENTTVQPQPVVNGDVTSQPLSQFYDYVDLVIAPNNPNILYMAINDQVQGSETGVYRSTDGGVRWYRLSDHPTGQNVGRIRLAVSDSNPNVVYSLIVNPNTAGSVYLLKRSVNGGITWQDTGALPAPNILNFESSIGQFPQGGQYAAALIVDPNDPDVVYVGGSVLLRSGDAGFSWTDISAGSGASDLTPIREFMWDRLGAGARLLVASDSGIRRLNTLQGTNGAQWDNLNTGLAISKTIALDANRFDENLVYTTNWHTGTNRFNDSTTWSQVDPNDGGTIVVDHSNPNNLYRSYRNLVFKSTNAGSSWSQIFTGTTFSTTGASPLRYAPLVMDPGNSQRLLFATNVIYETLDGGANWRQVVRIPEDWKGSGTGIRQYRTASPAWDFGWGADGAIIALGASTNRDIVYAVTRGEFLNPSADDFVNGAYTVPRIWVSTFQGDPPGGEDQLYNWREITNFLPFSVQGLTPTSMRVDPQDPRTVYLVYNYFSQGSITGKVIRVNNSNNSSISVLDITNNLPDSPVWALDIDPRQFGPLDDIIYVGTDQGIYQAKANQNSVSNWVRFGEDLPYAQVRDVFVNKQTNTMYAGLYGRGVWQIRPNATPTLTTVDSSLTTPEDRPLVILYNDLASRANEADRNGDALSFVVDQVFTGRLEVRIRQGATPAQDVYIPVTPGATRLEFNSASSAWRWTPPTNANNNTNGGAFLAFSVRVTDLELTSTPDVPVFISVTPVNDPPTTTVQPLFLDVGPNSIRSYSHTELIALLNPVIGPTPTDDTEGTFASLRIEVLGTIPAGVSFFRNGVTPLAPGDVIGPGDSLQIRTVGQVLGNVIQDLFSFRLVDDGNAAPAVLGDPDPRVSTTATVVYLRIQNSRPTLTAVNPTLYPTGMEDVQYALTFNQLQTAANEADVDGDVISFRITSLAGGTLRRNGVVITPSAGSPVAFVAGDTLTWTPTANANNLVNGNLAVPMMTVRAFDGFLDSTTDVTVRVNLSPTPDAPFIPTTAILQGAARNRPFNIPYTKLVAETGAFDPDNVSGIDPVTGQPLRFVILSVDPGTTLTVNGSPVVPGQLVGPADTLVWTPPAGFSGVAPAFTVRLWDGDLAFTSGNFSVNTCIVSVNTQNDRPLLSSVGLLPNGVEDTPYTIPFSLLFNNSDATDSNSDPLSFRVETVTGGTLTLNGTPIIPGVTTIRAPQPGELNPPTLIWLPPSDASGIINAFTVSAFDGELASTPPVQVRIAVGAVNDAPRFQQNQVFGGGVIENSLALTFEQIRDTMGLVDVDSPNITITVNTILAGELRKNGQLVTPGVTTLGPGETFLYNAPFGSTGRLDAFTITATDGQATSTPATVSVDYRGIRFYRSYNPNAMYHFFSTNRLEFLTAVRNGLRDESSGNTGVAMFLNNEADTNAVHRLRNPNTGRHYYTANTAEKNQLTKIGWIFERDENFISLIPKPGLTPVFRLYNASSGTHLYVDSQAQKDAVLTRFPGSWADHGLLGYAIPVGSDNFFSTVPGTTPTTVPTGGTGTGTNGDRTGPGGVNQPTTPTDTTTNRPTSGRATAAEASVADQGLVAIATGSVASQPASAAATSSASNLPAVAQATSASVDLVWEELASGLKKGVSIDLSNPLL